MTLPTSCLDHYQDFVPCLFLFNVPPTAKVKWGRVCLKHGRDMHYTFRNFSFVSNYIVAKRKPTSKTDYALILHWHDSGFTTDKNNFHCSDYCYCPARRASGVPKLVVTLESLFIYLMIKWLPILRVVLSWFEDKVLKRKLKVFIFYRSVDTCVGPLICLDARKSDFVACEQQRRGPVCASHRLVSVFDIRYIERLMTKLATYTLSIF